MRTMNRSVVVAGCTVLLSACATHTRGTWSCAADKGAPCQSIESLDRVRTGVRIDPGGPARPVEGAAALRWWSATDALAGNFDRAPRREPDQFVRVLIAGWTDASGDYHAPSEVYAVMRRGGWWAAPPAQPLVQPKASEKTAALRSGPPAASAVPGSVAPSSAPAGKALSPAPAAPPSDAPRPGPATAPTS